MVPSWEISQEVRESVRELARNQLTLHHQHGYERAGSRSPTIWIPKDPLGISEDEMMHARDCVPDIRISNQLAKLDMKGRLEITQNGPDLDVI